MAILIAALIGFVLYKHMVRGGKAAREAKSK
jgi:hypothetical protein